MNKPLKMVIYLGNEVLHVNQFFAGLGILHQKGLIDVKLKKALDKGTGKPYVECVIEGKKVFLNFMIALVTWRKTNMTGVIFMLNAR